MGYPQNQPLRVAIIGSGITGLSAAWELQKANRDKQRISLLLLEKEHYFGGHANTVDVVINKEQVAVDTGFLVFNERTYPGLIQLFKELEVKIAPSNMGFSVQKQNWLLLLEKAFPDVDSGDTLTGAHDGQGKVTFFYNLEPTASIQDIDFARHFFGIWLDPKTPEPQLRQALIGQPNGSIF
jgi:uncharacterized protein with NAD-binding domain and iron-sulfur cluster